MRHLISVRPVKLKFFVLLFMAISILCPAASSKETTQAEVVEVIDGDTIKVRMEGSTETVRYLLIDTPELHHPRRSVEELGAEAMSANRELVENRMVLLETDLVRKDRYGRLLAYVWLPGDDGEIFVNEELILRGYAMPMTIAPNVKYADRIREAFRTARSNDAGLWSRASGRVFTSEQAWWELPCIEGYFIVLEMRIREIIEKTAKVVILPEKGNFSTVIYKSDWDKFIDKLPGKGHIMRVTGKAVKGYHGGEIVLSDPAQLIPNE